MSRLVIPLFVIMAFGCSNSSSHDQDEALKPRLELRDDFWNAQKEQQHLLNRQDTATWDLTMLANDLAYRNSNEQLPFESAAFPNPDYDFVGEGSFKGVGNFGLSGGDDNELKLGDKTILYNAFYVGASEVNQAFVGDKKDEVFFQIIVLTDFVDTLNYSHVLSEVVSRNHPHYIGQGYYKTQTSSIDYSAFIAANRDAYAIVNMRLFDLKFGKTILIAPQKDGSFRSMQVQSPPLSKEDIEAYTENLLKEQEIADFFGDAGCI